MNSNGKAGPDPVVRPEPGVHPYHSLPSPPTFWLLRKMILIYKEFPKPSFGDLSAARDRTCIPN